MTDQQKISDISERRKYFDRHFPPIERCDARQDISFRLPNSCPSCGYMTLDERCGWEICVFCFWEDDGQDNNDADIVCGGPNSDYSLTAHRLTVYNWMHELKQNNTTTDAIEKSLGQELTILDGYISGNQPNAQLVLNQIELLSTLFNRYRQIYSDRPAWKFLTEKQLSTIKPAYNSLPKVKLRWWQKLFHNQ